MRQNRFFIATLTPVRLRVWQDADRDCFSMRDGAAKAAENGGLQPGYYLILETANGMGADIWSKYIDEE